LPIVSRHDTRRAALCGEVRDEMRCEYARARGARAATRNIFATPLRRCFFHYAPCCTPMLPRVAARCFAAFRHCRAAFRLCLFATQNTLNIDASPANDFRHAAMMAAADAAAY